MRISETEIQNALRFCWGCKDCSGLSLDDQCPLQFLHRGIDFTARGIISMARYIRDGQLPLSKAMADYLFREPLCGRCSVACEASIDIPMVIRSLRADLVEAGIGPLANHRPLIEGMRNYSNPWVLPRSRRADWARRCGIKDATKQNVEVLYYVGCTAASDRGLHRVAQSTAEILQEAGVDFGILGAKENCCGTIAYQLGDWDFFRKQAKLNIESLNRTGAKLIVTACAGCFKMLKSVYPRMGVEKTDAAVFHLAQYIEELRSQGRIRFKADLPLRVTYHDPCHLGRESGLPGGRFAGLYDAPRNVLAAIPGIELAEMERARENSWCCGAGGGLKSGDMDASARIGRQRLLEAEQTGAEVLVSTCPFCEQQFRDAITAVGNAMKAMDLAEVVREGIRATKSTRGDQRAG